jgi:predicted metal-binding membrane protein
VTPRRLQLLLTIAGVLLLFTAAGVHAQGCAQCLDTTRATPPPVQAAYRHAILLLGGVASTLFVAGLILMRREP